MTEPRHLPILPSEPAPQPARDWGQLASRVHCTDDVCITCSDEALPVTVREIGDDGIALVEADGATAEVSVELIDGVAVGDVVLVHAGVAIGRLEEEQA